MSYETVVVKSRCSAPEFVGTVRKPDDYRKGIRYNGDFVVTKPQNVSLSDA
jgi:hypothetical protein